MSNLIKQWIGFFFDGLPYSEEAVNAREKIEEAMLEQAADASPEELAERYGSCEKLAELGGYDAERVKAWRSTEALQDGDDVKKRFRAQRWRTYLFAALCAAVLSELIWTVYNAVSGRTEFFFTLLLGAALVVGAFFVLKKIRHEENKYTDRRYDTGTYVFLRDRSDKYAKRLLNSIALLFAAFALFFGSEFCFYVLGSSKPAELVENVFANMLLIQIPLFLVIKNAVLVHVLQKHIGLPDKDSFLRHAKWITVFSLGYWAAVIAGVLLFKDSINHPANIFITAGVIFFLAILAYNLTLRKRVTYRNIVFKEPLNKKPNTWPTEAPKRYIDTLCATYHFQS